MDQEHLIRLTRPDDINTLTALDLKTHQYPMPLKEWQTKLSGSGKQDQARIVLCVVAGLPVGFAMWSIDNEHNISHLLRLGVLPDFRLHGLGRLLVHACAQHSYEMRCDKVKIVVPDLNCSPGDPDDVSAFLNKLEFTATGEIIPEWGEMYGEPIEGYAFERQLYVTAP